MVTVVRARAEIRVCACESLSGGVPFLKQLFHTTTDWGHFDVSPALQARTGILMTSLLVARAIKKI